MSWRLLPVLLTFGLFPAIQVIPTVRIKYEYYDVSGMTAREIRRELARLSPIEIDGKVYDAYTQWSVRWEFWYNEGGSSCSIDSVVTLVDVGFTLPWWTDQDRASETLRERWQSYLDALHRHELGHKDLGVAAGTEVAAAIVRIPPWNTCEELEQAADSIGERIVGAYRVKEEEYDQQTAHGRAQGAIFP